MLRNCKNCGKEFDDDIINSSKFPKDYCSHSCYNNWEKFDEKYFSLTGSGIHILKDEYDVHHINEVKVDNRLENLQVLTRGEHSSLHNKQKPQKRDKITRRFISE